MKWAEIQAKLPSEKTPEAKAVRSKLFDQFDPNGNGYLSLAEVDSGVRDVLGLEDVFHAKAAIMRAFEASKNVAKTKSKYGADFVERSEFRLLLLYLAKYFELWEMFEMVDTTGDKRINRAEFKKAIAHVEKWGVKVDNTDAEFDKIDGNKGGFILFEEFADWGLKKHLHLEDDAE
ncbi:unnamed protein product [Calypogeia fissa]